MTNGDDARERDDAESPLEDALRLDFLTRFVADRSVDESRSLAHYLAFYPGHETTIANAYLQATSPDDSVESTDEEARRLGPYRLLRELGRGGQAIVWLAHDDRLDRDVALKTVPRSPLFEDIAPRFRREAMLTATLAHPGICPIYEVGADDRTAWIAMRHVAGESLAHRIASRSEPFSVDAALRIGERIAEALHAAHEAGIVHRDVKPGNVMLTGDDDEPVLLDFGIARDESGEALTLTGEALGTPSYMAPESLDPRGRVADRRVDVYALGVTLYEMLTGGRPFAAPTRDALVRAILEADPADPRAENPAIPRDLAIVLATALEKDPNRRYGSAGELASELRRVRRREPILARPAGPWTRLVRFAQRRPALFATLLALFLSLAVGFTVSLKLLRDANVALEEKNAALDRFLRLADLRRAADLLVREKRLWPAIPENLPAMRVWQTEAATLIAHAPIHRESIARPSAPDDAESEAWLREQTEQLLASIERVELAASSIARRIEFAESIDRESIELRSDDWRAAAERIARDLRFGSAFVLPPQRGLVPLGPDPDSRLEEFACLGTGSIPSRDDRGELALADDAAIVLVLIPGGSTRVGSVPTRGDREDDTHVDPEAGPYDGPVVELELDPYFLAKHELTQAQWRRHAGANPSSHQDTSKFVASGRADRHPVETVSWEQCAEFVAQLDLELPTEAQWEHAARAGATTPHLCDRDRLDEFDNLADLPSKTRGGHESWPYEPDLDDGYVAHAPVGSFRKNGFGLHDVLGNVREWCRDTWEDWATNPPRNGDGLAIGAETARTFRGGSFASDAARSRLSRRDGLPVHLSQFTNGLRVARPLRDRPR